MTQNETRQTNNASLPAAVTLRVTLARGAMLWERVWPALWPATGFVAAFLVFTLMEGWRYVPDWVHVLALVGFAGAIGASLWYRFREIRVPTREEAIHKLELTSGLPHRPIAAYEDELAEGERPADGATLTIWQAHQQRLKDEIRDLHVGVPRSDLPRQDGLALRFLALGALVVAIAAAGPTLPNKLAMAFDPDLANAEKTAITFDAWINPPAYTGEPPIFLAGVQSTQLEEGVIEIPQGAVFVARVQGRSIPPVLQKDGVTVQESDDSEAEPKGFEQLSEAAFEFSEALEADTALTIKDGGRLLGEWRFQIRPDEAPLAAFWDDIAPTPQQSVEIPYTVTDDYGVVSAKAIVRLKRGQADDGDVIEAPADDTPTPADIEDTRQPLPHEAFADVSPLAVEIPLPSLSTKRTTEKITQDLTAHPMAGLPVTVQLEARDERGQVGRSEVVEVTLPMREFTNPLSRALIEQRQQLVLLPSEYLQVARFLEAFTALPDGFYEDFSVYLGIRSARWRLIHARSAGDVEEAAELIWDIAIRLEDGDLSDAEQLVRDLQQELMDALAENKPQDEIDRIMQALRNAIDEYLAARIREGLEVVEPGDMGQMGGGNAQSLDDLLATIEEMLRTGNMEIAAALLGQLWDQLENMDSLMAMPGGGGSGNQELNDALGELGDVIGRQRGLLDETFRKTQPDGQGGQPQRNGRPQPGQQSQQDGSQGQQPGQQQGQPGQSQQGQGQQPGQQQGSQQGGQGEGDLAQEQGTLSDDLGDVLGRLRDQGVDVPQSLERALRSMEQAERELSDGDVPGAVDPQKNAIDQLRQGAQTLGQNLLDQLLEQQGLASDGNRPGEGDFDPLGRPSASAGPEFGDSVKVPEQRDLQRARDILEELRRRASELDRPPVELEYLERLLKRF